MSRSTIYKIQVLTTIYTKKVSFLISLIFLGFSSSTAATIDFDVVYGNTGNVSSNIQLAINSASSGDVIKFNSSFYWLQDYVNININKAVTFEGAAPVGFNQWIRGANGVQTTFANTATFTIQSNNVKFKNLKIEKKALAESVYDILIDARHSTYHIVPQVSVQQLQYTGLVFENVELNQGAYLLHAGNGVGITMTNVSMFNFRRIGFWTDRKGRINHMKRASFDRCVFVPEASVAFDDRAISLDAGNTEYPVIWNTDNTTVYNCKIVNSGIGLSRCHNMTVELTTFDDYLGAVDLLHIEEFSYDVRVKNNTFQCNSAYSKIFLIDRELQVSSYITITDNTITGTYNFFISSYAPNHLTVTGNDFSGATGANSNVIDLTYYETRSSEPIPFDFLSKDITISGNTGLGNSSNKNIRIFEGTSVSVSGVPTNQLTIGNPSTIGPDYLPPVYALLGNATYEIINKATGKKLASNGAYGTTMATGTGNDTKWISNWKPPYTYTFKNVATGSYLETHAGYTENDIYNNNPQNLSPFSTPYGSGATLPFWCIVNVGAYKEVFPGGNEKQSALATSGDWAKLIFAKQFNPDGTRSPVALGDNAKWTFNNVGSARIGEGSVSAASFNVYPNPADDILHISFTDQNRSSAMSVQIYDMQGEVVIAARLLADINHAVDISALATGVYVLKTDSGHSEKILVK